MLKGQLHPRHVIVELLLLLIANNKERKMNMNMNLFNHNNNSADDYVQLNSCGC